MTLAELQSQCRLNVFSPQSLALAPAYGAGAEPRVRNPSDDEARCLDMVIAEGVHWFAEHKPTRMSAKTWHAYDTVTRERVAAKTSDPLVCGFGLIIGALLSWLIGQALSWLWRWYQSRHDSPALVCGMVGG